MKMNFKADRPTIIVGSSLGLVLLLALYLVLQLWFLRQDFADEIETIQPRTARLLGMLDSVDQLGLASDTAHSMLRELVYAADQDSAKAASSLQERSLIAANPKGSACARKYRSCAKRQKRSSAAWKTDKQGWQKQTSR